jgi:hypothetical protein
MKFKRMSHPPYSPDIVTSDFYLFGIVKQRLQTCHDGSYDELQANMHVILAAIDPTELAATMQAWIVCLRKVIDTNGEYV